MSCFDQWTNKQGSTGAVNLSMRYRGFLLPTNYFPVYMQHLYLFKLFHDENTHWEHTIMCHRELLFQKSKQFLFCWADSPQNVPPAAISGCLLDGYLPLMFLVILWKRDKEAKLIIQPPWHDVCSKLNCWLLSADSHTYTRCTLFIKHTPPPTRTNPHTGWFDLLPVSVWRKHLVSCG